MPNICYAEIQVTGRKECIQEFEKILNANYNYGKNEFSYKPHFWRIFDVYPQEMEHVEGLIYTQNFAIDCAWSVATCMTDSPFSYGNMNRKDSNNEYFDTTLRAEAARLNLDIEIWSDEPGMCFEEHIHYRNREELDNRCYNAETYIIADYETYEDLVKDYGVYEDDNKDKRVCNGISEEEFNKAKNEGTEVISKTDARHSFQFKVNDPDGYNPFAADFPKTMCEIVK